LLSQFSPDAQHPVIHLSQTHITTTYNSASTNPQVTNLAAVELKQAGDTLNKADAALSKGESTDTVNQLAYIAKQQVAIAQETAKRKTAELAVTNASAERDQVRLQARTAEADAAKQKVAACREPPISKLPNWRLPAPMRNVTRHSLLNRKCSSRS
jgi:hypothetical protein